MPPPCSSCDKPRRLLPENRAVWSIWKLCSQFDRPPSGGAGLTPIPSAAVVTVCESRDETLETFERVMRLEAHMHPILAEKAIRAAKADGQGGED